MYKDGTGEHVNGVGSSFTGWSCSWGLVDSAVDRRDRIDPARDDSEWFLKDVDEDSGVAICLNCLGGGFRFVWAIVENSVNKRMNERTNLCAVLLEDQPSLWELGC